MSEAPAATSPAVSRRICPVPGPLPVWHWAQVPPMIGMMPASNVAATGSVEVGGRVVAGLGTVEAGVAPVVAVAGAVVGGVEGGGVVSDTSEAAHAGPTRATTNPSSTVVAFTAGSVRERCRLAGRVPLCRSRWSSGDTRILQIPPEEAR